MLENSRSLNPGIRIGAVVSRLWVQCRRLDLWD